MPFRILQFQTDIESLPKDCTDTGKPPVDRTPMHIDGLAADETGFFVVGEDDLTPNFKNIFHLFYGCFLYLSVFCKTHKCNVIPFSIGLIELDSILTDTN